MQVRFGTLAGVVVMAAMLTIGCSDLDKYQKPAGQNDTPVAKEQTLELKTSPEERERGRQFAIELDALRIELNNTADTTAALEALGGILGRVDAAREALAPDDQFGDFYLLMMADILNQTSLIRDAIGDPTGAANARARLREVQDMLPH